jgi:hypothetical protein
MENNFKDLKVYVTSNEDLYIFSCGENEKYGGTMSIDAVTELKIPYADSAIEDTIHMAFNKCFSKKPDYGRVSVVERYFGIRGFKKATANMKLVTVIWNKDKGYRVVASQKESIKGGYIPLLKQEINLGKEIKTGDIARAIKEAIKISST